MADINDILGADLQTDSQSSGAQPASDGITRDALGNEYVESRQGSGQQKDAGGTASGSQAQQAQTPATAAIPTGATGTQVPSVDTAAIEAARADAQAARQLASQLMAREQAREQAAWQARVQQLPPDQQRLAVQQRQVELAAQQVQAAQRAYQQQQQAAEPFMKGVAVDLLVKEFGDKISLPAETLKTQLSRCATPETMEALCQTLVSMSSEAVLQQRAKSGVDAAATAGSGTTRPAATQSWRQTSLRQQLTSAFND